MLDPTFPTPKDTHFTKSYLIEVFFRLFQILAKDITDIKENKPHL